MLVALGMTAAAATACGSFLGIGRDEDDPPMGNTPASGADADASGSGSDSSGALDSGSGEASSFADADAGPQLPKIVFLSKERWGVSKNINGKIHREAADEICKQEALAGAFPGRVFVAWLSETNSSALSRLGAGEWRLPDGKLVFKERIKIQSGPLVAIDQHADGTSFVTTGEDPPSDLVVWTGTFANGSSGDHCLEWTAQTNSQGHSGDVASTDPVKWTQALIRACDGEYAVLCFEQ